MDETTIKMIASTHKAVMLLMQKVESLELEISTLKGQTPEIEWLDTEEASVILKSAGVLNSKQLRLFVRDGILPVDGEYVRNRGTSDKKPRYQFNIPKCKVLINQWLSFSVEERDRLLAS